MTGSQQLVKRARIGSEIGECCYIINNLRDRDASPEKVPYAGQAHLEILRKIACKI